MYSILRRRSGMFSSCVLFLLFGLSVCGQKLDGLVDECDCTVNSIADFNSFKVYPQIQTIISKDYFRYFKVDLSRECPFWHDDSKCALKDCSVEVCDADEIPFVKAEKLRLGSGSGESEEELSLETSKTNTQAVEEPAEDVQNVPYYERAKTQVTGEQMSIETEATRPASVEKTQQSTINVMPTSTSGIKITMATTVQPTEPAKNSEKQIDESTAPVKNSTEAITSNQPIDDDDTTEASCKEHNQTLGKIDVTLSEESLKEFEKWRTHDDNLQDFCVFDDENSVNATYVDLLLNPERFTGYAGPSANRVWKTIYEENCFQSPSGTPFDLNQMCLEKRVFYRAISGLHSSINIHLCAEYYIPKMGKIVLPGESMWGPNLNEFNKRFSDATTDGQGNRRLRNLYFLYLLELRAINKASRYLEKVPFYTSRPEDTEETTQAVQKFLHIVADFKSHFNEGQMFVGTDSESRKLKEEFRQHFRNISTIMDCVGCDKCRLWGKLQTQGLGTALKILFSSDESLELSRTEIVTLFNAFSRLSNSLFQLENFKRLNAISDSRSQKFSSSPFGQRDEL